MFVLKVFFSFLGQLTGIHRWERGEWNRVRDTLKLTSILEIFWQTYHVMTLSFSSHAIQQIFLSKSLNLDKR